MFFVRVIYSPGFEGVLPPSQQGSVQCHVVLAGGGYGSFKLPLIIASAAEVEGAKQFLTVLGVCIFYHWFSLQ